MSIEHQAEVKTLAERFGSGDEDCLDEIVRGVCPAICRTLARRPQFCLLAKDELEHVVLNSLSVAWRDRNDYDPARGTLFAWLLAIANHAASNFARLPEIRARHQRVVVNLDNVTDCSDASTAVHGADDAVSEPRDELIGLAQLAIQALPDRMGVVVRADIDSPDGRAHTAVLAAELGVAPATIRDYRRRARPRLKAKLVELGAEKLLGAPRARPLSIREIEPGQNGKRKTENGKRKTENGKRKTENGKRKTENGKRKTENDRSVWRLAATRCAPEAVGWRFAHRCHARVASPGRYLTGNRCIP